MGLTASMGKGLMGPGPQEPVNQRKSGSHGTSADADVASQANSGQYAKYAAAY
jgi:hypothetical protein